MGLTLNGEESLSYLREGYSMKRSEINAALKEMEAMIREYRFALPP